MYRSIDITLIHDQYQMSKHNPAFQRPQNFQNVTAPHAQQYNSDQSFPRYNGPQTSVRDTQSHSYQQLSTSSPDSFSPQLQQQYFGDPSQKVKSSQQEVMVQQLLKGLNPYNRNTHNVTMSSSAQQHHLTAGMRYQWEFHNQKPGVSMNIHGYNSPRGGNTAQALLTDPQQRGNGPSRGSNGPTTRVGGGRYQQFVKPERHEDYFEGGSPLEQLKHESSSARPLVGLAGQHNSAGARGLMPSCQPTSSFGGMNCYSDTFRPGTSQQHKSNGIGTSRNDNFASVAAATAAAEQVAREAAKPFAKCLVLASQQMCVGKIKRLAMEVKNLKTERPNAVDKLYSASNRAHVHIQCEIESGPVVRGTGTFFCSVQFDGINIAVCSGLNKRTAKVEAFETALKKIMKPYLRIVEIDGCQKELQASDQEFSCDPPVQTVVKPTSAVISSISTDNSGAPSYSIQKESNVEAITNIKKRNYVAKDLSEFVLVEPQHHNSSVNGASILRRSADFSKMLLEYDFAAHGASGAIRCMLRVEGQVLADIVGANKPAAKIEASQRAVDVLRQQCWTILTKQAHDSNAPEITKEEIFSDLANTIGVSTVPASMAKSIPDSNKGKKLLQKMGWTGGGIGKDGTGMEEPVAVTTVINREGLGLSSSKGITTDFRQRVTQLLENYAASDRQDDLIFSPLFRKDERIIIHNECRRLNLKSNSKAQGGERFLIIRRKRSASQLLEHIMACGGETVRYKIAPPGQRVYPWQRASVAFGGM